MSKSLFFVSRETFQSHKDKALEKYWILQNADSKQIAHIKGDKQRWK